MKSYRSDDERDEYTRLVDYRGALLDERARVEALLEDVRPGVMAA